MVGQIMGLNDSKRRLIDPVVYLDSIGISFFGHRWTQIIKILKLQNNNIICVYLPACASHGRRVCENLLAP